jgi:hypothetical protein
MDTNPQTRMAGGTVGVLIARDEVAYDFNKTTFAARMEKFIEDYNADVDEYKRLKKTKKIDVIT